MLRITQMEMSPRLLQGMEHMGVCVQVIIFAWSSLGEKGGKGGSPINTYIDLFSVKGEMCHLHVTLNRRIHEEPGGEEDSYCQKHHSEVRKHRGVNGARVPAHGLQLLQSTVKGNHNLPKNTDGHMG